MAETVADLRAKLGLDVREFNRRLGISQKKVKGMGKSMSKLGGIAAGIAGPLLGAFAISKVVGDAFSSIKDFGTELANLSAITGATGKDLDAFAEASKEIGRVSTVSAVEAVKAFKLLASAKPELLENRDALISLTKEAVVLSEAAGIDLATAAEQLGSALNAMNLPASEASRIINVLAAASQKGAKEIPFINDALSKFGGIAAQAGIQIETSVAAIEILGKVIPEASIVGNNLKNIMIILQTEAAEQGRAFMGLNKELELLAPRVKDITFLEEKFGKENLLAAQTLISQRKEVAKLEVEITGTSTALEQQRINTDTLTAALKKLGNAWDDIVLSFSEGEGVLKDLVNVAGTFLKVISAQRDAASIQRDHNDALDNAKKFYEDTTQAAGEFADDIILTNKSLKQFKRDINNAEAGTLAHENAVGRLREKLIITFGSKAGQEIFKTSEFIQRNVKILNAAEKATKNLGNESEITGDKIQELSVHVMSMGQRIINATRAFRPVFKDIKKDLPPLITDLELAGQAARAMSAAFDENPAEILERQRTVLKAFIEEQVAAPGIVTPAIQKIIDQYNKLGETLDDVNVDIDKAIVKQEKLARTSRAVGDAVGSAFSIMSSQIVGSLDEAETGFDRFKNAMVKTILELIALMLAQSISQAIAGATASGSATGPAAVFTTPAFIATAVGGVLGAFAAIPKFAAGGLVTGPTIGMIGEGAGTSRSNPEVIAPLNKLQGMLNQTVRVVVEGRISGEDIILVQANTNRALNFIT